VRRRAVRRAGPACAGGAKDVMDVMRDAAGVRAMLPWRVDDEDDDDDDDDGCEDDETKDER